MKSYILLNSISCNFRILNNIQQHSVSVKLDLFGKCFTLPVVKTGLKQFYGVSVGASEVKLCVWTYFVMKGENVLCRV